MIHPGQVVNSLHENRFCHTGPGILRNPCRESRQIHRYPAVIGSIRMKAKIKAFIRCGILAIAICVLCMPYVLAASYPPDTAPVITGISLPDLPLHLSGRDSAPPPSLAFTQITYFNRTADKTVVTGRLPLAGGTLLIRSHDIITFRINGRYTGPAGTYAMLDLFNLGTHPLRGVKRVDAAVIINAGTTGILTSPPYWFNGSTGDYGLVAEFYGNRTNKTSRINLHVIP